MVPRCALQVHEVAPERWCLLAVHDPLEKSYQDRRKLVALR